MLCFHTISLTLDSATHQNLKLLTSKILSHLRYSFQQLWNRIPKYNCKLDTEKSLWISDIFMFLDRQGPCLWIQFKMVLSLRSCNVLPIILSSDWNMDNSLSRNLSQHAILRICFMLQILLDRKDHLSTCDCKSDHKATQDSTLYHQHTDWTSFARLQPP